MVDSATDCIHQDESGYQTIIHFENSIHRPNNSNIFNSILLPSDDGVGYGGDLSDYRAEVITLVLGMPSLSRGFGYILSVRGRDAGVNGLG